MGDRFRADYAGLQDIAKQFQNQSDAVRSTHQNLKSNVDQLRGKDWVGKGADKFTQEWDSAVEPMVKRLMNALDEASKITKQISQIAKQAEEESSGCFHL